ncbi:hypothetical protein HMPREF1556_00136 [Porphyromonas sp. oral taxon 278 str. W7784]|nr:hypothetical protein HMPREF1556_00136 [Porphyromonas sp. oral taxon 278 str. W7784]
MTLAPPLLLWSEKRYFSPFSSPEEGEGRRRLFVRAPQALSTSLF